MVASAYLTVDTGIESAAPNVSRTRKLTRRRSLWRPVARFDAPGVTLSRLPSGNGKRPYPPPLYHWLQSNDVEPR